MDPISIKYLFDCGDGRKFKYNIELDSKSLALLKPKIPDENNWAKLDNYQCSNCPLKVENQNDCPVAVNLLPLVSLVSKLQSYDEVRVLVSTAERNIYTKTTIQRGISSVLGLIMAASDCPHTLFFRGMARFHLPFADGLETTYRAASSYLMTQYYVRKKGGDPEWNFDRLGEIYRNLQEVNRGMANRIKSITENDAAVNAVILLDLFAKNIPYGVDDALEEIEFLHDAYIVKQQLTGK